MNRFRVASAALICACLMTLSACADDAATEAGSAPTAPASPAPTVAPASAAASVEVTPSSTAAAGGTSDKKLCQSAKKAGDDMRAVLVATLQSGEEPSPAVFKKILNDLNDKITAVAADRGDSKLAGALMRFGAEAEKAAAAADPATAADNPAFLKAGADLTAACKSAGVNVIF